MDAEKLIQRVIAKTKEFLIEGKVAGALALIGQTLRCDPDNLEANEIMGVCKYLISDLVGETQGAIDSFEKAVPSAFAYNGLALCYEKRDELKKARRFFEKAIEINDQEIDLKNNLIKCLIKMGEASESDLPQENSKILVGSVFANDNEFQSQLLDIQLKFLKATCNFDHVVCLSEPSKSKAFSEKTKIIHEGWEGDNIHVSGLKQLLKYFLHHQEQYSEFLFLDSDAFPVRKEWPNFLRKRMAKQKCFDNQGKFCFSDGSEFEIAAVLRQENLESRLHASALFVKKEALNNIDFDNKDIGNDILNRPEADVCIPYYQWEARHKAYPLIRTNRVNLHPIVAGIYGDCFYHHGAGTRSNLVFRSNCYHNYCEFEDASVYTNQLLADPFTLIGRLGWDINSYAGEQI